MAFGPVVGVPALLRAQVRRLAGVDDGTEELAGDDPADSDQADDDLADGDRLDGDG